MCAYGSPRYLVVVKKAVSRQGVGPVPAGLGYAGRGLGAQALDQPDGTLIAPGVSQVHAFKFRGSPAHWRLSCEIRSLLQRWQDLPVTKRVQAEQSSEKFMLVIY